MDKRLNRISLTWGVPGFLAEIAGVALQDSVRWAPGSVDSSRAGLGALLVAVGTVMLIVGLCYYAKAKGRNAAWGLLGILSLIGVVVLAVMPDRHRSGEAEGNQLPGNEKPARSIHSVVTKSDTLKSKRKSVIREVKFWRVAISFAAAIASVVWSLQFLGFNLFRLYDAAGLWLWLVGHVVATLAAWVCALLIIELIITMHRHPGRDAEM